METTRDDLLWGALTLEQPSEGQGPRVTVDTVLLAHFVRLKGRERVMELGCAHGALSLLLAARLRARGCLGEGFSLRGLDLQPRLVELARRNARSNGLERWTRFDPGDLRDRACWGDGRPYDAVVANPPYEDPKRSRPSSREGVALAVHGLACSLEDLVRAARGCLRSRGRLFLVMRAKRLGELTSLLREHRLEPKRLRAVHPKPDRAASVVLLEALRDGGPGLTVEPPLFIHRGDGTHSEELLEAYRLEDAPCP